MIIERIHISGYRSLRNLHLDLKQINVIVGPNASGKSNLYRALYLVAAAATGEFARELAIEGGVASVLWAGARTKNEDPRVAIEVKFDELEYELTFGRIPNSDVFTAELLCFSNDPDIKEEQIRIDYRGRSNLILKRKRGMISAKNMDGRQIEYPLALTERESVLSGLRDPQKFPELSQLREEILNWRFYHQFRTDTASPLRQPQLGVMTPVMSHDGTDVAAAIATVRAMAEKDELADAISDAFPGAMLMVDAPAGQFTLKLQMPGLNRAFDCAELSDGTLQYLCLLAALMTPRPPRLMVLNEPETSIHPDLYEPLAKLIVRASKRCQMIITTHASDLAGYLKKLAKCELIELEKVEGETRVKGAKLSPERHRDEEEE